MHTYASESLDQIEACASQPHALHTTVNEKLSGTYSRRILTFTTKFNL